MKNYIAKLGLFLTPLMLGSVLLFNSSCKKDDPQVGVADEDSIYYVTDALMHSWYYWYKNTPDLDIYSYNHPDSLMQDLRFNPPDTWSFVADAETIEALFSNGEDFSLGFMFRFQEDGTARIIYVYENSQAYDYGVRKGHILKSIDGTAPMFYPDFEPLFDGSSGIFTIEFVDLEGTEHSYTINKATVQKNGVLYKDIIEVGGVKTGYLVYDSFLKYSEEELIEAITEFQSNTIEELIIDLRYNQGGHVHIAQLFGDLLAPSSAAGQVAFRYSHNELVRQQQDTTINFRSNNLNLNLERVFFITTRFSASASELLINMLDPYMDVKLIGSPTHGKPMAMSGFLFKEWLLYPVTAMLVNANGFGDFFDGLPVDQTAGEGLDKAWGDLTDPNLAQALYYISNGSFDLDQKSAGKKEASEVLYLSSNDPLRKKYLIIE